MVVSSGFLDHAAEVYLRTNGLIMSAQSPITSINANRTTTEWSQSQPPQSTASNTLQLQPPLTQSPQPNQTNMQVANVKVNNNGQLPPARAILICHPNSHPFQTRNIQLEPRNEVKVGRSVPRSRVEESNAIFDCKVLSRNHAIIWFHDGKFFIKDTGSSNGTFINSQRIKASEPYEISSGDVVQFGVDVTENSRKETHGCIIAALKLITPDGVEKTSYPSSCNFDNDIFRLKQIMHESYLRELILEEKLLNLQKEVLTTRTNSSNTWQAMIHEDLLLSRIDILENKLICYQKNITNEKLQEEIIKLQDDKSLYQKSAKEALKKVYQDRMAVISKFTKFEQLWQSSEDELALLRSQLVASNENNEKLSQEVNNANAESIRAQIVKQEFDCMQIKESFEAAKRENDELKTRLQLIESINETELRLANENGSDSSDKNKNITMWNKQAITHWMNNSDLKLLKESDDIINAMCNDVKNKDFLRMDPQKCSQLYEKLIAIEKKLTASDNKTDEGSITETITIKSDESVSSTISDGNENNEEANDGNRNKQENDKREEENAEVDVATFRSVIVELKELYNEFLIQIKLMQKDLSRAAKCDELESKLIETMLELQSVQNEQRKENQVNANDSKFNNNNNNNNNQSNGDNSTCDLGATTVVATDFVAVKGDTVAALNGQNTIKKYGNDAQSDDDNDDDDVDDDEDDTTRIDDQSERENSYNLNNNIMTLGSETEQSCDTISISTVDTNNSSTNSIITETNSDVIESIVERTATSTANSCGLSNDRTEHQLNAINGSHSGDKLPLDKWLGQQNAPKKYMARLSGSKAAAIAAELAAAGLFDDDPATNTHSTSENLDSHTEQQHVGATDSSKSDDYDYAEEKEALESFDRVIEEECKLINETDILREEELVELKERCIKLTDDNISLRKEVEHLRLNSNKQITLLMYTAPLAVLIGYLFSLIFS